MKRAILVVSLMVASQVSLAESGPGCGWGSMVFEGKSGVVSNVLAATTNGTSGNQTFGMTSGTAGCDVSKPIKLAQLDSFLDSNLDKVAYDMSRGQGEALESLAAIMGVSSDDQPVFFSTVKQNFSVIFNHSEASRAEVVDSLLQVMSKDQALVKYVPVV